MSPVTILGICQILGWGSSFYLLAVLAKPIAEDTGWTFSWVVGGVSVGLLVAGLVSRHVGRAIHRHGGRPILIGSSLLLAVGLAVLSQASNFAIYVLAWAIIGLGMGSGLYDAAFSTLGRLYGEAARRPITALTLWGGFASTVCWPLSAHLVESIGWRDTCLVYTALHLLVGLPRHAFAVPRELKASDRVKPTEAEAPAAADAPPKRSAWLFPVLATLITTGSSIVSIIGVHLLTILQARDLALATAVALGALVGPSQVGARVVEILFGNRDHPIWTMAASAALMATGLAVLSASIPLVAFGLIVYASGVGIQSIARGTLPLALYGQTGYAVAMGRLAMPALIAQSISPTLAAMMLQAAGVSATLATLTGLAAANIALVALLWRIKNRSGD